MDNRENFDEEIKILKNALEVEPKNERILSLLGWLYFNKAESEKPRTVPIFGKDYLDNAIKCFQKSLELNPKNEKCWDGLGWSYFHKGRFDKRARKSFHCALEINSNYVDAWRGLGSLLIHLEKRILKEELQFCEKFLKRDKDNSYAWSYLGFIHKHRGNFDKAIDCFIKALKINPIDNETLNRLAFTYKNKGNFDRFFGIIVNKNVEVLGKRSVIKVDRRIK